MTVIMCYDKAKMVRLTVSSHDFNSQQKQLRVSNPRTIAYVHFEMPIGSLMVFQNYNSTLNSKNKFKTISI